MMMPILSTKLYIPVPRSHVVLRPHLIEQLNRGLDRKLTLVSASAGFGKTTLISGWIEHCEQRFAWLSLDEGDNDTKRFLVYFISALQTISPDFGKGILTVLQSPQIPTIESLLTSLVNEIATIQENFALVLDDYHLVDSQQIDEILNFLLDHLPPQMHLVMATREDPQLPLARLRARGQLTELRAADLRFTQDEVAQFFTDVMDLQLTPDDMVALDKRTEGWVAGLQLAAISMQGHQDLNDFIESFTGSHHFVLDYLLEEVLQQQPSHIQNFLLYTCILDRMCGSLCDAVLVDESGQEMLEYIERSNLFIIALDNERRWYRYHHLFADLLRQRLNQSDINVAELHNRASLWFEENGLELEAFQHAISARDIDRALHLIKGEGMPLYYRGMAIPILNWLESLARSELDSNPELWIIFASTLSIAGKNTLVEDKLKAAEAALEGIELDDKIRDLYGQIAAIRSILAAPQFEIDSIIAQSQRALELLHPENLAVRAVVTCTLGLAYYYQGDRATSKAIQKDAISISEATNNFFIKVLARTCLAVLQEADTDLHLAEETYRHVIELFGEPPPPIACEAYFGLARILYEWNALDSAQGYGEKSIELSQQIEMIDSVFAAEIFLARTKIVQGDIAGADALLAKVSQSIRQHDFVQLIPKLVDVQVKSLILQDNLVAASNLVEAHDVPLSQARVQLALGNSSSALDILETARHDAESKNWYDERLQAMVLQAIAHYQNEETDNALQVLSDALSLAETGGFIRTFLDEGEIMAQLLAEANHHGMMPTYIAKLQSAFEEELQNNVDRPHFPSAQPLIEPLSERELEVLQLVADGLSNREISERLFLALDTVKGHNRRIYGKLQVQRRTEAVARARELGLI